MPRKGRDLEVMVEQLQQALSASGIEVNSPEVFRNENGTTIGEIDVTLRGNFGAARIFVGIECRDRPANGKPEGVEWLWSIYGKKHGLKVDKMIAVSTTGFTDPAIEFAEQFGIDLISVTDVRSQNLADWFEVVDFVWKITSEEFLDGIQIRTDPPNMKGARPASDMMLWSGDKNDFVPFLDFLDPWITSAYREWDEAERASGRDCDRERQAVAELEIRGPVRARIESEEITVTSMKIPVRLRVVPERSTALLNAHIRHGDGEIIGVSGICRTVADGKPFYNVVSAVRSGDGTLRDLKVRTLDKNFKPYAIPVRGPMSLYGVK